MELRGDSLIAADRARVWAALNDPAILTRCLDGVDALAATTAGGVTLTEADPPNRCVLVGGGAGTAGSAKGRAEVTLADATCDGRAATRLGYTVTLSTDGEPPPAGEVARDHADTVLARLKAEVETPADAAPPVAAHASAGAAVAAGPPDDAQQLHGNRRATGLTPLIWGSVVVLVVLVVLVWQLA